MANAFIKAEQVVRTALGLLERQIVLPGLVWRDAAGDFRGAKNDTISIRLPAYAKSRKRALRAGTAITVDELHETKVDVTLSDHIYKAIGITDEELTLDIEEFGRQVLAPSVGAVARGMEEELGLEMSGATYVTVLKLDETNPYKTAVAARKALNDANVPFADRAMVCGSTIEAKFLESDQFVRADQSGSTQTLREAQIGRVAGFDVFSSNEIAPEEAYAFHQTAYVLSSRAPMKPEGATWGATESFAQMALRALRDYDYTNVRDRLLVDSFMGSNAVKDLGIATKVGGVGGASGTDQNHPVLTSFEPSETGTDPAVFVRALKIDMKPVLNNV